MSNERGVDGKSEKVRKNESKNDELNNEQEWEWEEEGELTIKKNKRKKKFKKGFSGYKKTISKLSFKTSYILMEINFNGKTAKNIYN